MKRLNKTYVLIFGCLLALVIGVLYIGKVTAQSSVSDCVRLEINGLVVYESAPCTIVEPSATPTATSTDVIPPTLTPTPTATDVIPPSVTPTPTPTLVIPPSNGGFTVDHNNLYLFDEIPAQYIEAVKQMDIAFFDASVGANINDGLSCLAYPDVASAPSTCKRPNAEVAGLTGLVPSTVYDRSRISYFLLPGLEDFLMADLTPYDVVSHMPNYLQVNGGSNDIVIPDYYEILNTFETIIDAQLFYNTTSLARSIGTEYSRDVNVAIRQFTSANGKYLLDIADIESHRPDGTPCYLVAGDDRYPIICEDYTTEVNGGHLGSVSAGKIKIAKGMWILLSVIAGWNPDGSVSPSPTPTVTVEPPTPTSTPTPTVIVEPPTPTLTPSPTPTEISGLVEPYADAPLCENHDLYTYHSLWNEVLGCHYDHTHGDNPHELDDLFGTEVYDLMGGEISYPWHTPGENEEAKHKSYMWFTGRDIGCFSQFDNGCVSAYRVFVHNDLFNVVSTHHSALVEAYVCDEAQYPVIGNDACGFIRVSGHQSTGDLNIDSQTVLDREQQPNAPQQFMLHHDAIGQKQIATWYPTFYSLMRVSTQTDDMFGYWKFPVGQTLPVSGVADLDFELLDGNASKTNVHLLGLGFAPRYASILNPDGDGFADYNGFVDVHTGEIGGNCTSISEMCAPITLIRVPVLDGISTSFQFRTGVVERDICFNPDTKVREDCRASSEINASGWITFPGFVPPLP